MLSFVTSKNDVNFCFKIPQDYKGAIPGCLRNFGFNDTDIIICNTLPKTKSDYNLCIEAFAYALSDPNKCDLIRSESNYRSCVEDLI